MATRGTGLTRRNGNLTRFDPWSEMMDLRRSMDDMFGQFFGANPARLFGGALPGQWNWEPNVDLYETPTELVFSADLPGYSREDINIQVTPDTLQVTAQHRDEASGQPNDGNFSASSETAETVNTSSNTGYIPDAATENAISRQAPGSTPSESNGAEGTSTAIQASQPQHPRTYHVQRQRRQNFSVSYTLPTEIDPNNVKASFKDGVLTVHLSKPEQARPKQVSVNVEG
jgi:HSP20 family protein